MQWMSEATVATFPQEVIERSASQVVLVDFWAPWCGPCHALGPILEAAVEARGGQAWLVKVNTDQERALALEYRVQGIPAVKAFVNKQLADGFVGAHDRRFVDAFLNRLLPSPETRGLAQAEQLLAEGKAEAVEAALGPALASPRHQDDALLLLARSQIALNALPEAEKSLAEIAKETPAGEIASLLAARVELLRVADGSDPDPLRRLVEEKPEDLEARWKLAAVLLATGQLPQALEELLQLMQRDRIHRNDGARRAMLSLFHELGPEHELSREYRRRMQIYL